MARRPINGLDRHAAVQTEAARQIRDHRARGVIGAALIAVSSILSIVVAVDTGPRTDGRRKTNAAIGIAISVLICLYLSYMVWLTVTSHNLKRNLMIVIAALYAIGAAATVVSIGFQSSTVDRINKRT
jgi:hypothetical protein